MSNRFFIYRDAGLFVAVCAVRSVAVASAASREAAIAAAESKCAALCGA